MISEQLCNQWIYWRTRKSTMKKAYSNLGRKSWKLGLQGLTLWTRPKNLQDPGKNSAYRCLCKEHWQYSSSKFLVNYINFCPEARNFKHFESGKWTFSFMTMAEPKRGPLLRRKSKAFRAVVYTISGLTWRRRNLEENNENTFFRRSKSGLQRKFFWDFTWKIRTG